MNSELMLEKLGVRGVINATGTLTVLGGSVLDKEVLDAMAEAAQVYIDMPELHDKAGSYVARLTGARAAYLTSGGAAALALSVAACMTRGDTAKMVELPYTDGYEKNELIVQKFHRNQYDRAIQITGAKIVVVGTDVETSASELERAIGDKTAGVVYFAYDPQPGVLSLDEVLRISHGKRVPVIVDAAAELPPAGNLSKFIRMGADLVIFSGGKDIGAPNDTGIILGEEELVGFCRRLGPHTYEMTDEGKTQVYFGRVMKISKEDILGLVTALERYLETDHDKRVKEWDKKAEKIAQGLSGGSSRIRAKKVQATFGHPRPANFPRVEVELLFASPTAEQLIESLKRRDPAIYSYSIDGKLCFNPQCLRDGEEDVVVKSLLHELGEAEIGNKMNDEGGASSGP